MKYSKHSRTYHDKHLTFALQQGKHNQMNMQRNSLKICEHNGSNNDAYIHKMKNYLCSERTLQDTIVSHVAIRGLCYLSLRGVSPEMVLITLWSQDNIHSSVNNELLGYPDILLEIHSCS